MAKGKISLNLLGEIVLALRDEFRELKATSAEQHNVVVRMLRRIEDRIDRSEELQLSLLRSNIDLEKRLRTVERGEP